MSAFSNSLVRISLYTSRGNVVLGEWNLDVVEGESENYIDPEVLASLVAVCICDGKSNNDPDRAVIKNLVDPDNPFVISNAAYTEGSGYADKDSPYYGAFVTDGKDDLITSTKTVKEMLGGSNEITVVSMMLNLENEKFTYTNQIRPFQNGYIRNSVISNTEGKCGIYGYKITDISDIFKNRISINDILGYRKDYSMDTGGTARIDGKFSVEGYCFNDGTIGEVSQVAWYWTIISKIALTTDQINQVISYFNLDKHVKPDIIYDTIRQGITNENHASFNDELVDFSGNGHNMKIYNSAWKLGSGIGKYEEDFTSWLIGTNINVTNDTIKAVGIVSSYVSTKVTPNSEIAPFTIKVTGIPKNGEIRYYYCSSSTKIDSFYIREDGQYNVPQSERWELTGSYRVGFTISNPSLDWSRLVIEQIPDYEGALVSDGVSDYGKVENLPIYKDYTVVADREIIDGLAENADGGVALKGESTIANSFIFDFNNEVYSFAKGNSKTVDTERFISYQSKYVNNGVNIDVGTGDDTDVLYLAKLGKSDRYSKLALWSFLLFPYSLSKFLLERQLKRYKLGTLYPDMIEWRPIAKSNIPYKQIDYFIRRSGAYVRLNPGDYFQSTEDIIVRVTPIRDWQLDVVSSIKVNGKNEVISVNSSYAQTAPIHIDKSPQKIDITIDEYIRYEDIVQPYPAIINLNQDGKTITWGDKLKVGSDIVFAGSANLLPELYTVSETRYNGVTLYPNTIIKVEKSMVFDNARTYLKANEPNCILSPNRLRIPNSSYKILRYIPDLTGKGNHGVINNSAYVGMSGANGYKYNWNTWRISKSGITCTVTDSRLHITGLKEQYNPNQALFESNTLANTGDKSNFKVNITGLTSDMKCTFNNAGAIIKELVNGVNEISVDLVAGWYGFMITTLDGSVIGDCDITIQQIGQYEGSFCFDGTDDHIIIPTIKHGGKALLMKVNWRYKNNIAMVYDQRINWGGFGISISRDQLPLVAYKPYNKVTYIDGIKNESVLVQDLEGITHNIIGIYDNLNLSDERDVCISRTSDASNSGFADMSMYDFMLFPDVPNEEEIQELNDIVGIEGGYVERPEYYWDVYGKTNSDADRATIIDQVSKDPVNALTANNFAFNEESGYVDNRLVSDGIEDNLKNTNMPVLTDYTWITKRQFPISKTQTFVHKGTGSNSSAFLFEFDENGQKTRSFGHDTTVVFPDLISYQTKNSYNGEAIAADNTVDGNQLRVFMGSDQYPRYAKAVFYKAILYSKTIDTLSINMLKNLFEKDELIDINNPIFKKQ